MKSGYMYGQDVVGSNDCATELNITPRNIATVMEIVFSVIFIVIRILTYYETD
ncbi:MAG: hypothetical protein ACI3Y8_07120 [Candidatus Cryptobacteroides sp.]